MSIAYCYDQSTLQQKSLLLIVMDVLLFSKKEKDSLPYMYHQELKNATDHERGRSEKGKKKSKNNYGCTLLIINL